MINDAFRSAVAFLGRFLTRHTLPARNTRPDTITHAQGVLRRQNAWRRAVATGYEAKRARIERKQGKHSFISANTGHVAPL